MDLASFFENLTEFEHSDLFNDIQNIWDPLINLRDTIINRLSSLTLENSFVGKLEGLSRQNFVARKGQYQEDCLLINKWLEIQDPVYLKDQKIFFGEGTLLEPSAIIKGPAIIGKYCDIRHGAYIRGNAIIGNHSVIGHCSEVKNSIIMNQSEVAHFNYVGDSIVGSYVNLGAGSKLANLQLRTQQEKNNGLIYPIKVNLGSEGRTNTKMKKLGSVLGDYVEIGCNSVISPGTFIGKCCWVYPNLNVAKGFYKPKRMITAKSLQNG